MEKTSWSIKCGKFKFGGSLAGGRLGKAWKKTEKTETFGSVNKLFEII